MTSDADKYLAIYFNDHLAGATTGVELAKRIRGENEGTELGAFVEGSSRRSPRTARRCSISWI